MSDRRRGEGLTTDGPPRGLLIAAAAIAAAAIATVIGLAATSRHDRPRTVVIPPVAAPQADSPECRSLLSALPQRLGEYQRTEPSDPVPPGAAAWQASDDEPVVLRCGLDRPAEFVIGAPIQVVNAVQWFQATDGAAGPATSDTGAAGPATSDTRAAGPATSDTRAAGPATSATAARSTWFAVDRPVYIALTLPRGSGPTPIQQLSDVIAHQLAAVPIRPGPAV